MSILALDVGDRRIGVAMSEGFLAAPLTTIYRRNEAVDIREVLRLAEEYGTEEIVVGLPLSLSGQVGPQAKRVAQFAETLDEQTSLPIVCVDERYSTVEAERLLRQAGVQPSREKARVDAAAAAVILQSYLDSRRSKA